MRESRSDMTHFLRDHFKMNGVVRRKFKSWRATTKSRYFCLMWLNEVIHTCTIRFQNIWKSTRANMRYEISTQLIATSVVLWASEYCMLISISITSDISMWWGWSWVGKALWRGFRIYSTIRLVAGDAFFRPHWTIYYLFTSGVC